MDLPLIIIILVIWSLLEADILGGQLVHSLVVVVGLSLLVVGTKVMGLSLDNLPDSVNTNWVVYHSFDL